MKNNLVSIIIPTFSRPINLSRAIDSVLAQTYSPIEIIVVDDNGEASPMQIETETVLSKYIENNEITYIKHKHNRNGSAARNTGVEAAKGFYVGLLDDDDVFSEDKIESQVKCIEDSQLNDETVKGCFCNCHLLGGVREYSIKNHPNENLTEQLLLGEVRFNSSTMLMDREAYLSIGGFDESYLRHQDWEFSIRFLKKYRMVLSCPDRCLTFKYQTPNIISKDPIKSINYLEYFLSNFADDIEKLPSSKKIYHYHYMKLSYVLFRNSYIKKGFEFFRKSASYKTPSFSELFRCIYYVIKALLKI